MADIVVTGRARGASGCGELMTVCGHRGGLGHLVGGVVGMNGSANSLLIRTGCIPEVLDLAPHHNLFCRMERPRGFKLVNRFLLSGG